MEQGTYTPPMADRATGGLEAVDQQIARLREVIDALGEDLARVSRFDLPEEKLAEVRSEPASGLRGFEARLQDLVEAVNGIRRRLDL